MPLPHYIRVFFVSDSAVTIKHCRLYIAFYVCWGHSLAKPVDKPATTFAGHFRARVRYQVQVISNRRIYLLLSYSLPTPSTTSTPLSHNPHWIHHVSSSKFQRSSQSTSVTPTAAGQCRCELHPSGTRAHCANRDTTVIRSVGATNWGRSQPGNASARISEHRL